MSKRNHRRQFLFMLSSGAAASLLAGEALARPLHCEDTVAIGRGPDVRLGEVRSAVKLLEVQFYHDAIFGPSLSSRTMGRAGRQVPFSDPVLRRHIREVLEDKVGHFALLSPPPFSKHFVVDLSRRPFVGIARAAGLAKLSVSFDPYANEHNFLLAAHMLESAVAPLHRYAGVQGEAKEGASARFRADAGYHAGLIRAAIRARELTNLDLGAAADRVTAVFARFGENDDPGAGGVRASLDAVLLGGSERGRGGFFPLGLPGVRQIGA